MIENTSLRGLLASAKYNEEKSCIETFGAFHNASGNIKDGVLHLTNTYGRSYEIKITDEELEVLLSIRADDLDKALVSIMSLKTEWFDKVCDFLKPFYKHDDKSHQFAHVAYVCGEALKIASLIDPRCEGGVLHINRDELIVAALAHDMFTTQNRDSHHVMAAQFAETEIFKSHVGIVNSDGNGYSRISNAILRHRASWKGDYTYILDEIISAADRGEPEIRNKIRRSYKYAIKNGATHEDAVRHAHKHIREKFARDGYASRSMMTKTYLLAYEDELENFYRDLEALTIEQAAEMCSDYIVYEK